MGIKTMLGLESSSLSDAEILHQIRDAQQRKQAVIEFHSGRRTVRLKLSQISPDGLMDDYQEYYSAK